MGKKVGKNVNRFERLFYPYLESRFDMDKLRNLWNKLYNDKRQLGESINEVYGEELDVVSENFRKNVLDTEDIGEIII